MLNGGQASAYGKCIAADYNGVYKDKCITEFLRLKDCYTVETLQRGFILEDVLMY